MATKTSLAWLLLQAQHAICVALHTELLRIDGSIMCLGHDCSGYFHCHALLWHC